MSSKACQSSLGTPPICCETKYKTKYGNLEIVHEKKTFKDAKEHCEKKQASLFALDTTEKSNELKYILRSRCRNDDGQVFSRSSNWYHAGLKTENGNGLWTNGVKFDSKHERLFSKCCSIPKESSAVGFFRPTFYLKNYILEYEADLVEKINWFICVEQLNKRSFFYDEGPRVSDFLSTPSYSELASVSDCCLFNKTVLVLLFLSFLYLFLIIVLFIYHCFFSPKKK